MLKNDVDKVVSNLLNVLEIFSKYDISASRIRSKLAELLVAQKLMSLGMSVEIGKERQNTNADLYLPEKKIRIEVKSGESFASFGNGNQIKKRKFDYAVFVPFEGHVPKKPFLFKLDDLHEIANPRPCIAEHSTNQCLLIWEKSYDKYKKYLEKYNEPEYSIEIDLHKNPDKYTDNWNMIKHA